MSRISVQGILNISAVKATACDCCACLAEIRTRITSPYIVHIVAYFALKANSDSTKRYSLKCSSITVDTCIVTHVRNVIASLCLSSFINNIHQEILKVVTLHAGTSGFIATQTTWSTCRLTSESNWCTGKCGYVIIWHKSSFTFQTGSSE